MKQSIKRLPKRTQEELNVLIELITQREKYCEMIILFGSYAKGTHVLWDERIEFGTPTTFQSDLDILVVVGTRSSGANTFIAESRLRDGIYDNYCRIFKEKRPTPSGSRKIRYAPPRFIVERIGTVNDKLKVAQYFFSDIVKEGIMIYDTGNYKLEKPCKKLPFEQIKAIAESEFDVIFPDASNFLKIGHFCFNETDYKIGSFQLHQACERYYKAIEIVFTNYKSKGHDLNELLSIVKNYSEDLVAVFPENTDFEKRCYKLICKAYIEARYNPDFVVTKEELEYMLERVEILKTITEKCCTQKIESYDLLIKKK